MQTRIYLIPTPPFPFFRHAHSDIWTYYIIYNRQSYARQNGNVISKFRSIPFQVGAVSLSKLASAAGAALVAVPTLPTHLLMRYVDLSSKLQQHRLNSSSALSPSAQLNVVLSDSGGGTAGIGGAGGGRACHHPMPEVVGTGGIIIGEVAAAAVGDGRAWPDGSIRSNVHSTHPPLHASSLRLFLGCLVKMLGEQQNSLEHVGGSRVGNGNGGAVTGGNPGHREGAMIVPGNVRFLGNVAGSRGGGGSNGLRSGGGEVGEVLRTLVKGEARSLGGVLDRRRQLGEEYCAFVAVGEGKDNFHHHNRQRTSTKTRLFETLHKLA